MNSDPKMALPIPGARVTPQTPSIRQQSKPYYLQYVQPLSTNGPLISNVLKYVTSEAHDTWVASGIILKVKKAQESFRKCTITCNQQYAVILFCYFFEI